MLQSLRTNPSSDGEYAATFSRREKDSPNRFSLGQPVVRIMLKE
jgi:hypothetical protein